MDNQEKTPINWDLLKKNIIDSFNELNQESKESYDKLFTKWTELGEKYLNIVPKLSENTWYINFINDYMPVSHDFRKNANSLNIALNQTIYDLNAKLKNKDVIINNQVIMFSEADKKIRALEAEIAKLKASQENSKSVMFGKNIVSFQDKKDEKKFDAMLFDLEELK